MKEMAQMKGKDIFMELWMRGGPGWGWEVKVVERANICPAPGKIRKF